MLEAEWRTGADAVAVDMRGTSVEERIRDYWSPCPAVTVGGGHGARRSRASGCAARSSAVTVRLFTELSQTRSRRRGVKAANLTSPGLCKKAPGGDVIRRRPATSLALADSQPVSVRLRTPDYTRGDWGLGDYQCGRRSS